MSEVVGCKCGDYSSYSTHDKEMGQHYTEIHCDKCDYHWEGYTNFELNKKPQNILCTNKESELAAETDKHMIKIQRCKNEDELMIEFARHLTAEHFIKERYKNHEIELKQRGIEFF